MIFNKIGEVLGKLCLHRVTPGLTIGLPTVPQGVPRLSPESPQFYPGYPYRLPKVISYQKVYTGTFQVSPCYPKVTWVFQNISPESSRSSQNSLIVHNFVKYPQLTKRSSRSLQCLLLVSQGYSHVSPGSSPSIPEVSQWYPEVYPDSFQVFLRSPWVSQGSFQVSLRFLWVFPDFPLVFIQCSGFPQGPLSLPRIFSESPLVSLVHYFVDCPQLCWIWTTLFIIHRSLQVCLGSPQISPESSQVYTESLQCPKPHLFYGLNVIWVQTGDFVGQKWLYLPGYCLDPRLPRSA